MAFLSDAEIEQALLEQSRGLGYAVASDDTIAPDGKQPERDRHDVVILQKRLESAVLRLNNAVRHPSPTRERGTRPEKLHGTGPSLTRRAGMGGAPLTTDSSGQETSDESVSPRKNGELAGHESL